MNALPFKTIAVESSCTFARNGMQSSGILLLKLKGTNKISLAADGLVSF